MTSVELNNSTSVPFVSHKRKGEDEERDIKYRLLDNIQFCQQPSKNLKVRLIKDVKLYHAVIPQNVFKDLFPNEKKPGFIRIRDNVYKVICNQVEMLEHVWINSESTDPKECQAEVMPFDPEGIKEAAQEISISLSKKKQADHVVKPFPIYLPQVESAVRQVLNEIFFSYQDFFDLQIGNHTINARVSAIKTNCLLTDVQKIDENTKIVMAFEKTVKTIDSLIAAFHAQSSEGRIFTFKLVKVKTLLTANVVSQKFLLLDHIKEQLKENLVKQDLMVTMTFKMKSYAQLENLSQPLYQLHFQLIRVILCDKEAEQDHPSTIYHFKNNNYKIKILPLDTSTINLESIKTVKEYKGKLTIKILKWEDDYCLTKDGLNITKVNKKRFEQEMRKVLSHFSLKEIEVSTIFGKFSVKCEVEADEEQTGVLYKLTELAQLHIIPKVPNLSLIDENNSHLGEDEFWNYYLIEKMKIHTVGGLPKKAMETMNRFIKENLMFLSKKANMTKKPPSNVLLISGPSHNGKLFLAKFIGEMFTPKMFSVLEENSVITNQNLSLESISRESRSVTIIRNLENQTSNAVESSENSIVQFIEKKMTIIKKTIGMFAIYLSSDVNKIPQELLLEFGQNRIEIGLPTPDERRKFLQFLGESDSNSFKELNIEALVKKTADFSRSKLATFFRLLKEANDPKSEQTWDKIISKIKQSSHHQLYL